MQKFKINQISNRDIYLAIGFLVCCVLLVGMVGDMIVHATTDISSYTATDYYRYPPTETYCIAGNKHWKSVDNVCRSVDAQ